MADTDPCTKNEDQEGCAHFDGAALSTQPLRTSESLLSTAWWEE